MTVFSPKRALLAMATACLLALAPAAGAKTLSFAGYSWSVRGDGVGNPADNSWKQANAWVDGQGRLHLRLTHEGGQWYSAEVVMEKRLGFGTYQFQLDTPVDGFDKNVVLGLFNYPTPDVGPDRTNEIDIEFARWGEATNDPLNYSIWPRDLNHQPSGQTYRLPPLGAQSTHRWIWHRNSIRFQAVPGHRDDSRYAAADYTFAPKDVAGTIGQDAMPVHINLWMKAVPSDGREVEVIVSDFRFTPDDGR